MASCSAFNPAIPLPPSALADSSFAVVSRRSFSRITVLAAPAIVSIVKSELEVSCVYLSNASSSCLSFSSAIANCSAI